MKKITLAATLLLLALGPAAAQKRAVADRSQNADRRTVGQRRLPIRQVQVTSQTLERQAAGKAYTLDLTRRGTIYALASGVDYSRVQVHTAKGDMTVAELIAKSGKNVSGALRVGMTSDIRARRLGVRGRGVGGLNYSCGDLVCACSGEDDCIDMFDTDKCGPIAICYPDGCICIRL